VHSFVQVDAIINTINKDLDLSRGAVSKSILIAAGSQIQDECKRNAPASFTHGDVIETQGYGLKAGHVYHGSCLQWDHDAGGCEQVGAFT
jgi:O-acetyl-ADP-ribose deacetylase (regulator of RNase III)